MHDPSVPYAELTFEDFRKLAQRDTLSKYERIGFPDAYRQGIEMTIFQDITTKVTNINKKSMSVIDIGPGCSDLPCLLIDHCSRHLHRLALVDSQEMLNRLPEHRFISREASRFPDCRQFIADRAESADVIICYSVFQYVFGHSCIYDFLDSALSLLAPHGQFIIGDIPNVSRRKRLLSSETGKLYHKEYMNTDEDPLVEYNKIEHRLIDDSVIYSLLMRARAQGYDAFVLPQNPILPMANRREDILIVRP